MTVKTGLDVFIEKKGGPWRGKRWGLILHQASVTRDLRPALPALSAVGTRPSALFAPEHGLAGTLQDQAPVKGSRDRSTGLPVHSLYGNPAKPLGRERPALAPSPAALRGLDGLLFDLQDIGVRYYTFIWTMALALEACARAGKTFIVLDRPNPLGGEAMEGNLPDPAYASFVGLHPVPVRHGMTCGELALYLNAKNGWKADLQIVKMRGWKRAMRFDQTGLPWVPPSPNMPSLETAAVYAGACLLEATNISEGRGTTRPFETVGAPFVDGPRLARALNARRLPGVVFRPVSFLPTFNKWAGQSCGGVFIHVTDRRRFPSFLSGLALIQTVRRLHPGGFRWKKPPYEYEVRRPPMDALCGTDALRRAVEGRRPVETLAAGWAAGLRSFGRERRPFLLYY